ncbi:unnamed protein product, partial [Phaeothamnion confervicola]
MQVTQEQGEKETVLRLEGRLVSSSAADFEKTLLSVIDGGATRLALDLTDLEMVSSAGLRIFLVGARRLKTADARLALFGASPR